MPRQPVTRKVDDAAPQAIAIVGPTASGKSAAARAIASAFGGTIVNADSMQVYRELAVLTARPDAAALAAAPHRLYGVAAAAEPWSAARWRDAALSEIANARAAGSLPILVGGTGLYIKALTQGLADIPAVPAEVRAAARRRHAEIGAARFHGELAALDAEMGARLAPGDTQRVLRAYEVVKATGRSIAAFQREGAGGATVGVATLVIAPGRAQLDPAIAARCAQMMDAGAAAEVAALNALGLDRSLPAMKAVGVPELTRLLSGEIDAATALELFRTATRQYAKRQRTWFRHQANAYIFLNEIYSNNLEQTMFSFVREIVDRTRSSG